MVNLNEINYLYHATPACNVSSIKKSGLGGKITAKKRLYEYEGTPYDNITTGVFFANDEYVAESYVETSEAFEEMSDAYEGRYGIELKIVVFKVDVKDLDLDLLSIDSNQQYDDEMCATYFYNGVIPFDKLEIIKLY